MAPRHPRLAAGRLVGATHRSISPFRRENADMAEQVIATEDTIVHDETLGIDRKVFAGQPVPPDLVEAYENAGKKTRSGPSSKSGAQDK